MRDAWIATFKEMDVHMNSQEIDKTSRKLRSQLITPDAEEDDDDAFNSHGPLYIGKCVNGMVRSRASRNAAANMSFQGLVAYGAKLAGWNLLSAGYQDRLLAFIHDEYVYWLWPEELDREIPVIEELMLQGMAVAIPDVKIGCETSCCRHWDKKACEYAKLPRGEDGKVVIEENAKVKEIYGCS